MAQWGYALGARARFIDRWRAILNAPEGTVTTSESVTTAVHALVTSLPEAALRGRRLLVAADCFPSLHFLLTGLQDRMGFTLDTVPLRQGATWVEQEDLIARWGPDVGLALLTWVSSTSSHRIDLDGGGGAWAQHGQPDRRGHHAGGRAAALRRDGAGGGFHRLDQPEMDVRHAGRGHAACGPRPDRRLCARAARLVQPARSVQLGTGPASLTPPTSAASTRARRG